jgi:RNA polymerase sigma factor (sigma-70 family)
LAQETSAAKEMRANRTELDTDTEKGIDFRVTVKIVNDAIAALPPQQQRVYSLCQHEGLKYAEAAERLNIAPGTVQAHMKQALRNIRKYVSRFAAIIF